MRARHRARELRRLGALGLESDPPISARHQQVKFRSLRSCPVVAFRGPSTKRVDDLLDHEPLERGAHLRSLTELGLGPGSEHRMEHAAVPNVDLGRLHLTLRDVRFPWPEDPDREEPLERLEPAPDRRLGGAEGTGELRGVPSLAMPVREHQPEPTKLRGRHAQPDIKDVTLEIRAKERLSPLHACGIGPCSERARESAPDPQPSPHGRTDLVESETVEVMEGDAPRQALAPPGRDFRRGAPEQEEPRRERSPVEQWPEGREDGRQALDLVDDHKPAKPRKHRLRFREKP
jgi:hypothetical protein